MSWFNVDELCIACCDEEATHPDYDLAKAVETAATRRGNTNFPGVGWPGMDGRVDPLWNFQK